MPVREARELRRLRPAVAQAPARRARRVLRVLARKLGEGRGPRGGGRLGAALVAHGLHQRVLLGELEGRLVCLSPAVAEVHAVEALRRLHEHLRERQLRGACGTGLRRAECPISSAARRRQQRRDRCDRALDRMNKRADLMRMSTR